MLRHPYRCLTAAALGTCLVATDVASQEPCANGATLQGVAREIETGVPLGFTQVSLWPVDGSTPLATRTDRAGAFALCGLRAGTYEVSAALAEYTAGPTPIVVTAEAARDHAILEIVLAMSSEVFALDTISVEAEARELGPLGFEGFEERRASGFGVFVLPEEIKLRNPSRITDVLREAGVAVENRGQQIYMRRTGCAPLVYIDGMRVTHLSRGGPTGRGGVGLFGPKKVTKADDPTYEAAAGVNMVHPSDVRAIEVYRSPGETPSAYMDSNAQCGVILIWTWRGPPKSTGG